ncbi:prolyl oligopeptidase family serine peptidase [Sphingomicrobium astaxanthinifaciens]|uniref:prolyl oligopeptidase family serine peptidase n=1 Tax=Sphingomicrobium astaxanthinifaciens TaxID=1227949 RepID=UPI001FCB0E9D|nr:prolyl oligopeptidase family serine peptidase [Sphingomicrobium astaxanthinifaciens]MCJ7421603.1 prolyl oligopeptidase family serine peptidase [Sphingomicrobium astaxanthinifaciens]
MRVTALTLALLATTACATTPATEEPMMTAQAAGPVLDYPETKKVDAVDTVGSITVADPYRWLENDVREDPEVAAWVAAQNAVTDAYLDTLPGRDWFKARMTELYNYERIGLPTARGGRYFFTRNDGLQPQSVLHVREGLEGPERMLIDPNMWSDDGATALAGYVPSEDGSMIAYMVQDGGSDWMTIRVLDVATGKVLEDEIEWVKFSGLAWAKDGSGFYYSRFPATEEGGKFTGLNTDQAVYFHQVGTPQSADELVFARPDNPELNNTATVSDDGRYLITSSSTGTDGWETGVIDLEGADRTRIVIEPGVDYETSYVGNAGTTFYFATNRDAPRGGVFKVDITDPQLAREWVIAEDEAVLDSVSHVGGHLIADYLVDVKSEARVHAMDGSLVRKVDLPGIGSAGGFGGDPEKSETFYAFSSFGQPGTIYRYDVATGESSVWAAPEVEFDPADYVTEQVFYTSKDGTRVPMFITRKRGVEGPVPTLLYGYGGFNISVTPSFNPVRLAWLDAGGAYAVANIRGGGEYGKAWHDAGRRGFKQNVFDDFAAAGEWLKANGVTTADGLAIEGRSNGGLLVGASINQRPDLFDAGHAAVGVMDMARFDRFTAGRYWVDDYNRPQREADLAYNLTYSPYHNVRAEIDYPALIITTADTDDRVVPAHSFKLAAMLQEKAGPGDAPLVIRIETRAGHGAGKPTDKIIEEASDVAAFLAKHTGLKTPRDASLDMMAE